MKALYWKTRALGLRPLTLRNQEPHLTSYVSLQGRRRLLPPQFAWVRCCFRNTCCELSICQICLLQKNYKGFTGNWGGNSISLTGCTAGWILSSNPCFLDVLHTRVRTTSLAQLCSEYFPCREHCVTLEEWEEWVLFHTRFGNLLPRGSIHHWKKMPYSDKSLRLLGN